MGSSLGRQASGWLLAIALAPATALAGDWHSLDSLVCSDCHTMHNSSGGQPMRYDSAATPAPALLRHASSLALCVYCHDGSNPGAPDVIAPVSYVSDPAAGFFANVGGVASPNAHDLALATAVVPPGGSLAVILTCTTCHAPHGTASYRNLAADPSGQGGAASPVSARQTVLPTGTNPAQVYVGGNVVHKGGMSKWCGRCHGDYHGRTSGQEGTQSPWLRHPQEQTISTSTHVDFTYWLGPQTNRVVVQSPTDDLVPSADDQVFCLSCHKAHGSPNRAALVFADGSRQSSTCDQCHNP